jgi:hypothetical protein
MVPLSKFDPHYDVLEEANFYWVEGYLTRVEDVVNSVEGQAVVPLVID